MQLSWPEVIGALGGQTIFLVAAAWLIRRLVSHGMDRDLAKYKAELKAEADRDIEKLRNDLLLEAERLRATLRISELEHRVRFSKLHETRAEVIAKIYAMMVQTDWTAQGYVYGDTRDREKAVVALDKIMELRIMFEQNRLYLPESVCQVVDKFIRKVFSLVNALKIYFADVEFPNARMRQEQNEKMLEVVKALETDLPGMKMLLEVEFRKLLGAADEIAV